MNEYQDQETWWRLSIESRNGTRFELHGDYDSREEAQEAFDRSEHANTGVKYMIRRMRGTI